MSLKNKTVSVCPASNAISLIRLNNIITEEQKLKRDMIELRDTTRL